MEKVVSPICWNSDCNSIGTDVFMVWVSGELPPMLGRMLAAVTKRPTKRIINFLMFFSLIVSPYFLIDA